MLNIGIITTICWASTIDQSWFRDADLLRWLVSKWLTEKDSGWSYRLRNLLRLRLPCLMLLQIRPQLILGWFAWVIHCPSRCFVVYLLRHLRNRQDLRFARLKCQGSCSLTPHLHFQMRAESPFEFPWTNQFSKCNWSEPHFSLPWLRRE